MTQISGPGLIGSVGDRVDRWLKIIQVARGDMSAAKTIGRLDYPASARITAAEAALDRLSQECQDFRKHFNCAVA